MSNKTNSLVDSPHPWSIYLSNPHIWPTCNHRSWVIMISMCALTREDGLHHWKPWLPLFAFSLCLSCSFWGMKLGRFTLKIVGTVQVEPGFFFWATRWSKKKRKKKAMWILRRILLGKKKLKFALFWRKNNEIAIFTDNIAGILKFSNFLYECSPIWLSLLVNNQPTYLTKLNI